MAMTEHEKIDRIREIIDAVATLSVDDGTASRGNVSIAGILAVRQILRE